MDGWATSMRMQARQKALGVRADLDKVRDHAVVKVLAAQVRVARRCLDLHPSIKGLVASLPFSAGRFGWTQIDAPRHEPLVLQNAVQRWSFWLVQNDDPRHLPPVLNNAV